MPQLGETVTEGTVIRWLKQVGDQVAPDELIFEVSTDKVDSEVPAAAGGYLAEILVPEGETVPVGTRLAVLSDAPPGDAPAPAPEAAAAPAPVEEPPPAEAPAPVEAPAPAPAPAEPPAADNGGDGSTGMLLSPVVRRLITEHGLDPAQIPGTGEGGRITRSDVLGYIDRPGGAPRQAAAPAAAPAPAPTRPSPPAPAPPAAPPAPAPPAPAAPAPAAAAPAAAIQGGDEHIPFDNIRRRTAEHMVRSKHTSPHVLTAIEVDFEAVDRVRAVHKAEWREREGFALTYLPFVARAVCDTLAEYTHLNASVGGDQLIVHRAVNLGIAVDLDERGLIVPVVKGAGGKRLRQIARDVRDLAERARNRKLTPDDVTGGTFTITNPGPFGTLVSAPIINQPQVAILSTDGVKKRPVVVESPTGDAIGIHHVGILAMSWDHRAIDGAYAARFLNRLKEIIETRDWEAELA